MMEPADEDLNELEEVDCGLELIEESALVAVISALERTKGCEWVYGLETEEYESRTNIEDLETEECESRTNIEDFESEECESTMDINGTEYDVDCEMIIDKDDLTRNVDVLETEVCGLVSE